jgi:hypothetical protein
VGLLKSINDEMNFYLIVIFLPKNGVLAAAPEIFLIWTKD